MRISILFLATLTIILILSCNADSEVDTDEFILEEGKTISLIASEPMVILPVAISEDEFGQIWAVEMTGYMRDIDGTDEDIPDGRLVILTDLNNDGVMNKRTVFLDSLLNPRAVSHVYNGVLFTDGSMLKFAEIKQNKPSKITIVDSLYVVGGNIEHQPNGLLYNIDNWIYSAKSNARYQYKNGNWVKEVTTFRGQWGISSLADGRLVYNNNSVPLVGDVAPPNILFKNPYVKLESSYGKTLTSDYRIYPIQATAVNRGYQDGVLDEKEMIKNYTSACGPLIYYGNGLGAQYYESAFVCAPEANIIAAYDINNDTMLPSANRFINGEEFLVSNDESFRPVNLATAYDGSLLVVDMRKGIIQHRAYMSNYLREKIKERKLDEINYKGRIYRVYEENVNPKLPKLGNLTPKEYIELLSNKSLKIRLFAQQALINNSFENKQTKLSDALRAAVNPEKINHLLWALEGCDGLNTAHLTQILQTNEDPQVIQHVIWLFQKFNLSLEEMNVVYEHVEKLDHKRLDYLLAAQLGSNVNYKPLWENMLSKYPNDDQIIEALIAGLSEPEYYQTAGLKSISKKIAAKLDISIINKQSNTIKAPKFYTQSFDDDRTNGYKIYTNYCAACHGMDGQGQSLVAPSLETSDIIQGDAISIANTILNGIDKLDSTYRIPMPLYTNDPNLDDQDIMDVISYLKSTFTSGWSDLKLNEVDSLRRAKK